MSSRDQIYLPRISDALLVPVDSADDAIFQRRVTIIKTLITELEDENNLIAYKIAKTRRRIEEKKARLASQQAPESKGFWGGRKTIEVEEAPKSAGTAVPAKKRDRTKSKPRPSKGAKLPIEEVIPPLSTDELAHLSTGHAPTNAASRDSDEKSIPRKPSQKSLNGNGQDPNRSSNQRPPERDPNDMDVDDFDDY